MNRKLASPYYKVLVRREESERMEAFEGLLEDLRTFCSEIRGDGPFYFGDEMSMVSARPPAIRGEPQTSRITTLPLTMLRCRHPRGISAKGYINIGLAK